MIGENMSNVEPGTINEEPATMLVDYGDVTLPRGAELYAWVGEDGAIVFQIDTIEGTGRVRVYINDAPVFDQDPETVDGVERD